MSTKLWWGNPQKFTARMWEEVAAMKAVFDIELTKGKKIKTQAQWDHPFKLFSHKLKLNVSKNPRQPFWMAEFSMKETVKKSEAGSNDKFTLKIEYPVNYPAREPKVWVISHKLGTSLAQHIFPDDSLCLHNHNSTRTGWDPGQSKAATFGLWSVEWVRAWMYSKRNGNNWPDEA